jgi:hypothetical protein
MNSESVSGTILSPFHDINSNSTISTPKPNPTQIGQQTDYRGKPERAKNDLINTEYKCENDEEYSTFIRLDLH